MSPLARSKSIEILVVGVGSIGRRHMANLGRIGDAVPLRVSVVEPHRETLEAIRLEKGHAGYESLEEALAERSFDAALICSPSHTHVPQAKTLLRGGCHVFVEKPLAIDQTEAAELAPVVATSSRILMVACNLRFHPGVKTIAKALAEKRVGRPLFVRAHFSHYLPNWRPGTDYTKTYSARSELGGGILLDAIHEPDYLFWLFGLPHEAVGKLDRLGDLRLDAEDTASYLMCYDGVLCEVHVDYLRRDKSRGCVVVGSEGTLVWESTGKNPENVSVRLFDAEKNEWVVLYDNPAYDLNQQYIDEMRYFLSCLQEKTIPMNGFSDAFRVMGLMDAVRKSSQSGRAVSLEAPTTGSIEVQ